MEEEGSKPSENTALFHLTKRTHFLLCSVTHTAGDPQELPVVGIGTQRPDTTISCPRNCTPPPTLTDLGHNPSPDRSVPFVLFGVLFASAS